MKTSARGVDLIKQFEGFRGTAYEDPVGVWTIGYGFTKGVKAGDTMTRKQADTRLARELRQYEAAVEEAAGECNQNQFDAITCFAWNVGIRGMQGSSVVKAHRRGDFDAAARAFGLWNKAGGKVWPGLTRRRTAEAALYLEPVDDEVAPMPQAVEPESNLLRSPIVASTSIGTGAATLSVVADSAKSARDIKDSLGDALPWILAVVAIAAGGYVVFTRWRQRRGGWA